MKMNLKAGIGLFAGICITASMLSACVQRAENATPYGTQRMMGTQYQGFVRNYPAGISTQPNRYAVPGTGYGTNPLYGTNLTNTVPGTNVNWSNVAYNATGQLTDNQRALDIKRQLTGINGIKRVNVLIFGDTTLVGFQGNPGTNVKSMKNTIAYKVKQIDKLSTRVKVTDSADIMNRMDKIGANVGNNTTTKPFVDEFNRLIQGL